MQRGIFLFPVSVKESSIVNLDFWPTSSPAAYHFIDTQFWSELFAEKRWAQKRRNCMQLQLQCRLISL